MTNDTIHVSLFSSFAHARAAAGGALDGAAQPGPFDRLGWFEALHASAFPEATPLILCAKAGSAMAWLFLTGGQDGPVDGITNWYSFLFRPQFVSAPLRETRLRLLSALAARLRGVTPHLRFHPITDEGGSDRALLSDALRTAGWRVIPRVMAHKRMLHLAPGMRFDAYWAARPGSLRSTFRRKARQRPVVVDIHHRLDEGLWSIFESVFAASWKPEGDDFAFLRAFAQAEAEGGRLRLGVAWLDGAPAAVELWTVEQGCAYIHKLAFDERFADASPGTQLSHAMFRQAIDLDHATRIDFGTGDNGYKAAWMPETVPMWQIDAFDLRHAASWRPAFATWLSALSQPTGSHARQSGPPSGRRAALDAAWPP
ncbi:CelD-like protein [Sphingobium sp. SYK-6]|uniref:GNAT family N-acetyltransferase n=1 Tax=Sphingobium sp. (strain NBRC 103272 / SYK-6) TaxID=627192 RepID=UPI0002277619|nr:GNAT family N-acetyltransferase [Sphingobium sp. SYK-6]BAK67223.1 CelD-like protein [Sphingobium sp. SYK-6]